MTYIIVTYAVNGVDSNGDTYNTVAALVKVVSDDDFIRNRREMFYDRRYEAALETAAEAEQAEATANIDAGADELPGGDLGVPGGTGVAGTEPDLGSPTGEPAAPDTGGEDPGAAGEEGDDVLLATPPAKRDDKIGKVTNRKGHTTTTKSHGYYEPRGTKPGGDRRSSSGPRKKNMNRAVSPEFGTKRKNLPGYAELSSLVKGTRVYEDGATNYKVEESKMLQQEKELKTLFESLKERDKKDETETQ